MFLLPQRCRGSQSIGRSFIGCSLLLLFLACSKPQLTQQSTEPVKPPAFDDAALQLAATTALGEREGTVIVMNPYDGRIRAVVNPRLAFEQSFPPGSTIKPFTALVALRSGIADQETRIQCDRVFQRDNYEVVCTHKRVNNSLKLHHALAYSCNYFFSNLAERLNVASFFSTLDSFGLGQRTGVNASEVSGKLTPGEWLLSTAIGNDDKVLVTPIQLITSFTALINGGHLLRPRVAEAVGFVAQEVRALNINPTHRAILMEGLQGSTEFGSAAEAGLQRLPYDVIGKTGTSGASNGFRTQGWFVSFLLNRKNAKRVEPSDLNLATVVFLKQAHGAEAVTVAAEFYRRLIFNEQAADNRQPTTGNRLRVHLVREHKTVEINPEDYVRGVLAAESSVETEPEALKAQAIVSRTFALKNRNRHQRDGYDLCSLTHCQRYVNKLAEHNKALILRAADETAGQLLNDERGQIADVYFHAACGGMTTNMEAVWGEPSPSYLQTVRDDYCTTMSHRSWTQAIPAKELLRALQSEERSNMGARMEAVVITKRDKSGRAEMLTIEGERRRQLRGWDFALIVNRVLGWNQLKSARFEVVRVGNNFIFRGSGFGHGLGLCQEGAHVMARRGMSAIHIIAQYFPGIKITEKKVLAANHVNYDLTTKNWLMTPMLIDTAFRSEQHNKQPKKIIATENFRLSSPNNLPKREIEETLRVLESAHQDFQRELERASLSLNKRSLINLTIHESTLAFIQATGQPSFAAGATRGGEIHLQPLSVLRKRGILATTLRHELIHALLDSQGQQRSPRWMMEGLAIHFAGEGRMYPVTANSPGRDELEKRLAAPQSAQEMRQLYGWAYEEVRQMIRAKGAAAVWRQVLKPSGN